MSHPILGLATWQSAVFLLNSRLTPFTAAPSLTLGHPFFLSYGARLPSSLTRFHSRALVYSTHPPVSVYGTGGRKNNIRIFLIPPLTDPLWPKPPRPTLRQTATFNRQTVSGEMSPNALTPAGAGILNLLSIAYASRHQLRSRLTLGGRTFPRKPWVYGGRELHPSYRYSCLHPHFFALHGWLPSRFDAQRTLSYHSRAANGTTIPSFGITLIANHFRREITR